MDQTNLPKYKRHKIVEAMKIALMTYLSAFNDGKGEWCLTSNEEGVGPIFVSPGYAIKHNPQVGGYYVRYDDGYESFSQREAFEAGYTRLEDTP